MSAARADHEATCRLVARSMIVEQLEELAKTMEVKAPPPGLPTDSGKRIAAELRRMAKELGGAK